jgi:hypothetical protein
MWAIDFKYFYRITDDNFIQIASSMEGDELKICAQYKLRHKNLKENIVFILKELIEAHLPYEGFPVFQNSTVFTEQEYDSIIQKMKDEKLAIIEQARANQSPLINYLKEQNFNPRPTGNTIHSWVTKCPCGGNHHLIISTLKDEWGCGYCNREGRLPELKKWLYELRVKQD